MADISKKVAREMALACPIGAEVQFLSGLIRLWPDAPRWIGDTVLKGLADRSRTDGGKASCPACGVTRKPDEHRAQCPRGIACSWHG